MHTQHSEETSMSFWKTAGELALKAGKAGLDQAQAAGERSQQYKVEMPLKSDPELFNIIKRELRSSPLKVGAAVQELKDRGYSQEDIKAKIS